MESREEEEEKLSEGAQKVHFSHHDCPKARGMGIRVQWCSKSKSRRTLDRPQICFSLHKDAEDGVHGRA
jgi:hypothetical protein